MNVEYFGAENDKAELIAALPYMTPAERKAVSAELQGDYDPYMGAFPLIPIIKGLVTAIPRGVKAIVEKVKARKAAKAQAAQVQTQTAQAQTMQANTFSTAGGKIPPALLFGIPAGLLAVFMFTKMRKGR
jgi:hypothetical protein